MVEAPATPWGQVVDLPEGLKSTARTWSMLPVWHVGIRSKYFGPTLSSSLVGSHGGADITWQAMQTRWMFHKCSHWLHVVHCTEGLGPWVTSWE